ncbi:MAG TPA: hypothetical protein VNR64_16205, partial [Vicinamibacterales bacterium]|nr:hypothetical protein [Vicinamibacterales bacterium]
MRSLPLVIILLALQPALAFAQNDTDHEDHRFVYEVGWSGEHSKAEGFNGKGLSTGIEITPIENWLAIETSVGIH